jgi:hypothetical protein
MRVVVFYFIVCSVPNTSLYSILSLSALPYAVKIFLSEITPLIPQSYLYLIYTNVIKSGDAKNEFKSNYEFYSDGFNCVLTEKGERKENDLYRYKEARDKNVIKVRMYKFLMRTVKETLGKRSLEYYK